MITIYIIQTEKQQENAGLKQHISQIDCRTFHPKTGEYTIFSSTHGVVSRIDHILSHKTSLSNFKKIKILLSILFTDHNTMKEEIPYKGKKKLKKTQTHRA